MPITFWRKHREKETEGWEEPAPLSEDPELREIFIRNGLRVAAAFATLFFLVYLALWWSGAAVGYGAGRASGQVQPTWRVFGTVRSSITNEPIPWAVIEDDSGGKPPFFQTDASYQGSYELLTLAEPHRLRISAPGFAETHVSVGRAWFLWMPRGRERRDIYLEPK